MTRHARLVARELHGITAFGYDEANEPHFTAFDGRVYRLRKASWADDSTVSRTASIPARCPATRGSLRPRAQRPLPSMMMATWRGTSMPSRALDAVSGLDIVPDTPLLKR